jgi:hypothetical protein
MLKRKAPKRIDWKVRRIGNKWEPVVMIGNQPVQLPLEDNKTNARTVARRYAVHLQNAGN